MAKGKKECPKCGATCGCRKLLCDDCGYSFAKNKQGSSSKKAKTKKHPLGELMLAPGLWVFDIPKGMPRVPCPEPMSPGPISNQEAYDLAEYNGLGECVLSYIPSKKIADPV